MADILQHIAGVQYQRVPSGYIEGTGIVDPAGFQITADGPGNTTFSVTAGVANFISYSGSDRIVNQVFYPGATGIAPTFLTTAGFTSLGIHSTGILVQKSQEFFTPDEIGDGTIPIGGIAHVNLTSITGVVGATSLLSSDSLFSYLSLPTTFVGQDCDFTPNANLTFNYTGGTLLGEGIQRLVTPTKPYHVVQAAQSPVATFNYSWSGGTNVGQTQINPNQYDNAGTLTAVPTNDYSIQYLTVSGSTGSIFAVYGQKTYNTFDDALNDIRDYRNNTVLSGLLRSLALRTAIVVRQGSTNLANTTVNRMINFNKFGDS